MQSWTELVFPFVLPQIEMLVEQQQVYQNQVIEKEEQVEKLLHELDQMKEFEAENVKLKARTLWHPLSESHCHSLRHCISY